MRRLVEKMPLNIRRTFGRPLVKLDQTLHDVLYPPGVISYSSCCEDLLIYYLLQPKSTITYIDIGAYHPRYISNTYFFYRLGHRGICVEPNPRMVRLLQKHRPADIVMNVAVVTDTRLTKTTLYVPAKDSGGSTLKREIFDTNRKVDQVKVGVRTAGDILDFFRKNIGKCPDFVSMDVESQEYDILEDWPFDNFRPSLFCVEVTQNPKVRGEYSGKIDSLMLEKDYLKVVEVDLNSIYLSKEFLEEKNR